MDIEPAVASASEGVRYPRAADQAGVTQPGDPGKPRWIAALIDALGLVAVVWSIPLAIVIVGLPIAIAVVLLAWAGRLF